MILTNKFGLPDTIVNVLKRPHYSKGDSHISVTELLSPPQIVQLRAKHDAEIEQDASEMVWSLFGTAVHNVLEHGKDDHHIVEERIFTDVDGWRISGQLLGPVGAGQATLQCDNWSASSGWNELCEFSFAPVPGGPCRLLLQGGDGDTEIGPFDLHGPA